MLRQAARGFTLMELTAVLAVLAMLAQGFYLWKTSQREDAVIERTVRGFLDIDEGLYAYRIANEAWPGDITGLSTYIPNLVNVDAAAETAGANGAGLPYRIEASGDGIIIKTTMLSEAQARAVAQVFPNTATFDTDSYEVTIGLGIPGLESSHAALFSTDGSKSATGTWYLDGHDILDVGEIAAETAELDNLKFSALEVVGESCESNAIATSGDGILCCVNDVWAYCLAAGTGTVFYEGVVIRPSSIQVLPGPRRLFVPDGFTIDECSLRLDGDMIYDRQKGAISSYGGGNVYARVDHWEVWMNQRYGSPPTPVLGASAQYRITCNRSAGSSS